MESPPPAQRAAAWVLVRSVSLPRLQQQLAGVVRVQTPRCTTRVGHRVLAMITSTAHRRWPLDVPLGDLEAAGLPAPSMVRMKLFTLDDRLIERRAGALTREDARHVHSALARVMGFKASR